jgi:hypothetical protein
MIDAVREEVGNEWLSGKLNSLEQRFKQEIRAVFEMGFPGIVIDFKPQVPTWPRSYVIHNILIVIMKKSIKYKLALLLVIINSLSINTIMAQKKMTQLVGLYSNIIQYTQISDLITKEQKQ